MPFNMLLLPLLGGYIFVRFWNYTRIHVLRSDKDRLIIRASIAGLFALFASYALSLIGANLFPCQPNGICIATWWNLTVPFEYSGISLGAFILAAVGWWPLNLFFTKEEQNDRAINEDGDPMELLLKRAQDENIAVSITMTNEKIYIGFVVHKFNPATPTNNIGIFPLQSGCREPETKRMKLTTNYSQAYEQIANEWDIITKKLLTLENEKSVKKDTDSIEKGRDQEIEKLTKESDAFSHILDRFEVVIPVKEIASISYFDSEVHRKYFPYETEKLIVG